MSSADGNVYSADRPENPQATAANFLHRSPIFGSRHWAAIWATGIRQENPIGPS